MSVFSEVFQVTSCVNGRLKAMVMPDNVCVPQCVECAIVGSSACIALIGEARKDKPALNL